MSNRQEKERRRQARQQSEAQAAAAVRRRSTGRPQDSARVSDPDAATALEVLAGAGCRLGVLTNTAGTRSGGGMRD